MVPRKSCLHQISKSYFGGLKSVDQKSEDWYEWRRKGIGASDAPIIMGVSPYKTPYQLWEDKTGRRTEEESNWATRRGNENEPRARAHYEFIRGVDAPPRVCEHYQLRWLRASLDGYYEIDQQKVVIEIKCPGKAEHEGAKEGKVPAKYYPQCQHQLMVTGADRVDYISYNVDIAIVEVYPDREYISNYLQKALAFWQLVQTDTPPPFVDRDFRHINSREVKDLLHQWFGWRGTEHEPEALRGCLDHEKTRDHQRWRCGPYRVDRGRISIVEALGEA